MQVRVYVRAFERIIVHLFDCLLVFIATQLTILDFFFTFCLLFVYVYIHLPFLFLAFFHFLRFKIDVRYMFNCFLPVLFHSNYINKLYKTIASVHAYTHFEWTINKNPFFICQLNDKNIVKAFTIRIINVITIQTNTVIAPLIAK